MCSQGNESIPSSGGGGGGGGVGVVGWCHVKTTVYINHDVLVLSSMSICEIYVACDQADVS